MSRAQESRFATQLQVRASVLAHFELEWLGLDTDGHDNELDAFLLIDCGRTRSNHSPARLWRVTDEVRRSAARLGKEVLRDAWRAVSNRPDTPEQQVIDRLIGHDEPVDLEGATDERLQAIALVSRWFEMIGPPVPSLREVENHVNFHSMLEPLRLIATEHFRDRTDEMAALARGVVGVPILIIGRGGIGKSALLGRHLLDAVERNERICYLNFDHSVLDPLAPGSIVAAIALQLSWQVDNARAIRLQSIAEEAQMAMRRGASYSETASRTLSVDAKRFRPLLGAIGSTVRDRQTEIVFDTLEEAQRRDWDLRSLRQLFEACIEKIPNSNIVASGRADVGDLSAERVFLEGLPRDDAVELLSMLLAQQGQEKQRRLLKKRDVERVVDMIGTSPLVIRLAAGLLQATSDDEQPLADLDLQQGLLEGELYRRLLGHIEDEEVRAIGYPGLTLRRITPHIIQHVLARPCEIRVDDPERARELFNGLASEAMLVDRYSDDVLLHRSDIRPLMLERLARDNAVDVKKIHRAAITYYEERQGIDDRVEELYHRLMLEQSPSTIDKHWESKAADGLQLATDDLPPSGRAYLLAKAPELETYFSPDEIAELDAERARPVFRRSVERLVAAGGVREAAELLAAARTADGAPELPLLELQVRELLGNLDAAAQIAAAEEHRLAVAGDVAAGIEIAMHRARIWQRMGDVKRAARHLAELHVRHRLTRSRAVDDLLRLRLAVMRLRLDRLGGSGTNRDELADEAIALFDTVPRRTLVKHPSLLRDLTGELGPAAPTRCIALALETGVLDDPDGTIAAGLMEFDEEVSKKRGAIHVLAEVAEVAPADGGQIDWDRWVQEEQSSKVATKVGSLIRQFEAELPSTFRESITKQYRDASDGANEFEV